MTRKYREKHPDEYKKYLKDYRGIHKERMASLHVAWRLKRKYDVLTHYGNNGILQCCWPECSITDIDMLSLDHIKNDGNQGRKENRSANSGMGLYNKIIQQGFPEGFQTLCWNHQIKKEILKRKRERKWNSPLSL